MFKTEPSLDPKYDQAFMSVLQNCEKITNFLDVTFSFLYRRTDFYLHMEHERDTKGFPPGVAAKLAYTAFKKYEDLAQNAGKSKAQKNTKSKTSSKKPSAVPEKVHVPEAKVATIQEIANTTTASVTKPSIKEETASSPAPQTSSKGNESTVSDTPKKSKSDDGDDVDPVLAEKQKVFQANPESYNGAIRDNYSWSQQISDLDIRIQVPSYVKKGKCVKVDIKRKRLKAEYLDEHGEWVMVVDGELTWDINKEESIWTLVPGEHIHVNIEKVQERWWEAIYTNEEHISVRKIDPSRPMTDLDDEAQAKIGEMMYNQKQKHLGLPQSHEQQVHHMLEKAWDTEGSPFRGTPFDPSQVNVQSPGSGGGGMP